jgi:hypothetical protein
MRQRRPGGPDLDPLDQGVAKAALLHVVGLSLWPAPLRRE